MGVLLGLRIPLVCVVFAMSASVGWAANTAAAAAPAVDCSSLVLNMADCLSFVTEGSTAKTPEGTCCSGLKTVLKTDAECICEAFRNSAQLGVTLNVTKALTLPTACHVSSPSVSNCGLSIDTGTAPALSPLAVSPSSVAGPSTEPVGANEVSPASGPTGSGSSGSSSLTVSIEFLFLATSAVILSLPLFM
ncbi:hypothetical protein ABFX02_14G098200 [Erythranthe guttata]